MKFKTLGIYLKHPVRFLTRIGDQTFLRRMSDERYLKMVFKDNMGYPLNLDAPTTFNEKIQWLKLYDRKSKYTIMVDKYAVKKYVADQIGEEYIIPTLGVWDRFDDIDFDSLPNQFVLKCTHDSGGLIICRDKKNLDKAAAKSKIERCFKRNYYWQGREWPYKDVKPRIIAEQYMEDNLDTESKGLTDYKFYCFDGNPEFLYISRGLEDHSTARISFVNLDWTFAPYQRSDYRPFEKLPARPANFDEMIEYAKKLSEGIPFLRVDLYQIGNRVYFSELTFSPCSGIMPFKDPEYDKIIGDMIKLPKIEN